jgi:hypothetical protein
MVDWWWIVFAFGVGVFARPYLDALFMWSLRNWKP